MEQSKKIRVVLDTNVLVSAAKSKPKANIPEVRGLSCCVRIVAAALEGKFDVIVSSETAKEYFEILSRKNVMLGVTFIPPIWLHAFIIISRFVLNTPHGVPVKTNDPDDLPFLALAYRYNAIIVTNNIKDYPKNGRSGVTVLTPFEFAKNYSTLLSNKVCVNLCCFGRTKCINIDIQKSQKNSKKIREKIKTFLGG